MDGDTQSSLLASLSAAASVPRVSVITVVRNAPDAVAETMRSVAAQSGLFEHLLIDGASTDDTLERIRQLASRRCRVISEPDRGIYDAMNKGMRMAGGDWLIFMNAGDRFHGDEVLCNAFPHMKNDRDVLLGETITILKDSLETRRFHGLPRTSEDWWKGMPACHQSIFYRRSVIENFPFNLKYTWCADYDQFVRLVGSGANVEYLSFVVALYDGNGGDQRDPKIYIRERQEISRMLKSGLRHSAFFANESIRLKTAPLQRFVQKLLPDTWRLTLRRLRRTAGVAFDAVDDPQSLRKNQI